MLNLRFEQWKTARRTSKRWNWDLRILQGDVENKRTSKLVETLRPEGWGPGNSGLV